MSRIRTFLCDTLRYTVGGASTIEAAECTAEPSWDVGPRCQRTEAWDGAIAAALARLDATTTAAMGKDERLFRAAQELFFALNAVDVRDVRVAETAALALLGEWAPPAGDAAGPAS